MVDIIDESSYTKIIYHITRAFRVIVQNLLMILKVKEFIEKFVEYKPFKGEIPSRNTGVLISCETGKAMTYALWNIQRRGQLLFITPQTEVYEGMIVGISAKNLVMS